jgi:hypothetical protein
LHHQQQQLQQHQQKPTTKILLLQLPIIIKKTIGYILETDIQIERNLIVDLNADTINDKNSDDSFVTMSQLVDEYGGCEYLQELQDESSRRIDEEIRMEARHVLNMYFSYSTPQPKSAGKFI